MSNTVIQIKRSGSTATPGSLQYGELAYSFQSGKLFIGNSSNTVIAIGGNTYNQIIDAATSLNTSSTLVKRDASGNFSAGNITANLFGNANTATSWQTTRNINVSGDASGTATINGTADSNVALTLATVNSNLGTFGGTTNIPVLTVNAKGLVTSAANVAVSSSFTIAGDTGTDLFNNGETLTFTGGDGITSTVTNNNVTMDVDNTVIRTTGNQTKTGTFSVIGDFNVSGNTTFTGNTSYINIETYKISDPLIYLAANNYTSDIVPIGFAANYYDGTSELHTGLFRQPQSNTYYLFTGVSDELSGNNNVTPTSNGFTTATLVANITQGTVSNLKSAVATTDGGTGLRSYVTGDILYASAANTLSALAAASSGNVLLSGSTPSYGKVGLTTHVSGILPIVNGGTNNGTLGSAGSISYSNGTSYTFSSVGSSGQAFISGGSGTPTFGTLTMTGGGLGITSVTANSVLYYSGTGTAMSYTNTPSDGHVLQYSTSAGISFSTLDGGNF